MSCPRVATCAVALVLCSLALATSARADDGKQYTIALFTPDVTFKDSIAKTTYIDDVAKALAATTGLAFKGISFARSEDLKKKADAGELDFAIVSGPYFAASGLGKPIAYAGGQHELALLSKSAGEVFALKGKRLILPRAGGLMVRFVGGTVLGGEVDAQEYFKVTYTKDVQSALAALQLGQADATLAYDSYATGGVGVVHRCNAGPMPVVVSLGKRADRATVTRVAAALQGMRVNGGGILSSFDGQGEGIGRFRALSRAKGQAKTPVMSTGPKRKLKLDPADFSGAPNSPKAGSAADIVPQVQMPEPSF